MNTDKITIPNFWFRFWKMFSYRNPSPTKKNLRDLDRIRKLEWSRPFSLNWKQIFRIISQEHKFSRKVENCEKISVEDISKIIQIRNMYDASFKKMRKDGSGDLDAYVKSAIKDKNVLNLLKKYEDHITYELGFLLNSNFFEIKFDNLLIFFSDSVSPLRADEDRKVNKNRIINIEDIRGRFFNFHDVLQFHNCVFLGNEDWDWPSLRGFTADFIKNENSTIKFKNCLMRNSIINIMEISRNIKATDDNMEEINKKTGKILFKRVAANYSGGFSCESYIRNPGKKGNSIRNMLPDRLMAKIIVKNCNLDFVKTQANFLTLIKRNRIKNFSFVDFGEKKFIINGRIKTDPAWDKKIRPIVDWGMYQKITPNQGNWEDHKNYLVKTLRVAEELKNDFQISVIKREIMKCDHRLILREPFWASWQDRVTYRFNHLFSNYGISWLRPLGLFLGFSFIFCLTIFRLMDLPVFSADGLFVFMQLLNPLSNFGNITLLVDAEGKPRMLPEEIRFTFTIFYTFQKVLFALCIYEIIRAGRRFTRGYS